MGINRGALALIIIPDISIYMMKIKWIRLKQILFIIIFILSIFFIFGRMGNLRDNALKSEDSYILRIGGATNEYINTKIPSEYFWCYLYIASPIGNLQNIITYANPEVSFYNFISLIFGQVNSDFIAKRLLKLFNMKEYTGSYLVRTVLNAPTVYYNPYGLLGWVGMIFIFLFMLLVVFLYLLVVKINSVYFLTGWSFLIAIIILNTFSNMWYYNGLYLVSFSVVLTYCKSKKLKKLIFNVSR
jgi:hypothetical protein